MTTTHKNALAAYFEASDAARDLHRKATNNLKVGDLANAAMYQYAAADASNDAFAAREAFMGAK